MNFQVLQDCVQLIIYVIQNVFAIWPFNAFVMLGVLFVAVMLITNFLPFKRG